MGEKGFKDNEDTTKGNWNIARSYTNQKILNWLVQIDDFRNISVFGFKSIDSDIYITNLNLRNTARLHGLKRWIHAMIFLIRNTKFAVHKESRNKFEEHIIRLLKIKRNLFKLKIEKKRGKRIVELNIDEDLFEKVTNDLDTMMDDINSKLNKAGLIFTPEEEFDIKDIKKGYKEKFVNRS
jgi:hypothetical protein